MLKVSLEMWNEGTASVSKRRELSRASDDHAETKAQKWCPQLVLSR